MPTMSEKLQALMSCHSPGFHTVLRFRPHAVAKTSISTYGTHITVDSVNSDYQGDSDLEMVFHESSHALDTKLFDEFADEFKLQNARWPRQSTTCLSSIRREF